jgi:hypothetical protein
VLGGVAAISTYDPEHFGRARLGEIDRLDDIRTDIALGIAAADGIDQDRVFLVELADLKPSRKDGVPAFVVGTGGELRNIVNRKSLTAWLQLAALPPTPIRNRRPLRSRSRSSSDARSSIEANEIS